MGRINRIFIICSLFTCNIYCSAQTEIAEEIIPLSITKWFYNDYPKAEDTSWKQINGGKELSVNFLFESRRYKSIYNLEGKRIEEVLYLETTPINIKNELYERFEQFKIKSVIKKTSFPSKSVNYILQIKRKGKSEQEIVFDQTQTIISTPVTPSKR